MVTADELGRPCAGEEALRETFLVRLVHWGGEEGAEDAAALRQLARRWSGAAARPDGVRLTAGQAGLLVEAVYRDLIYLTRFVRGLFGEDAGRPVGIDRITGELEAEIERLRRFIDEELEGHFMKEVS